MVVHKGEMSILNVIQSCQNITSEYQNICISILQSNSLCRGSHILMQKDLSWYPVGVDLWALEVGTVPAVHDDS
jgi:hypothetical protein